jgi:hypothetical protein
MSDSLRAEGSLIVPDGLVAPPAPAAPKVKLDIAYRFSNIFGLNNRQSELDFVDVLVDADIPLYVDPFAFKIGDDDFSIECNDLVISYFQELVDALRCGDEMKARRLLENLHEPNETRLGVSRPKPRELPQGRGVGTKQAQSLYAAFAKSKAVQTGILTDLSDCELFIEGISHDKISDVTVNIIRRQLVDFTKAQCRLHGVPMEKKPTGVWWHEEAKEWRGGYDLLPVYKGSPIILVPKAAVRYRLAVDYQEYYGKHVIEHIRQEYEKQECLSSADSLIRVLRGKRRRVSKKSVKEDNPASKQFLREFSEKHPDVLAAYKRDAQRTAESGTFRPTDSDIYETEKKTAHNLNLYLIEEVTQVQGDVIIVNAPVTDSVIGHGAQPHSGQAGSATHPGGRTVIQFIAGDRGGGPRAQLQLPREERQIREAVALGAGHDSFDFAIPEFAASIDDVIACHQRRPSIVHFTGHGEERQMVLVRDRDPLVEMMRLHQDQVEVLFRNFPVRVRLVFFNTCHCVVLIRHLAEKGVVDMAIGIESKIPDDHAVRFAVTFYRQLAEGRDVQTAFDLAGIHTAELQPAARPQLFHAADVNPAAETFCCPRV